MKVCVAKLYNQAHHLQLMRFLLLIRSITASEMPSFFTISTIMIGV